MRISSPSDNWLAAEKSAFYIFLKTAFVKKTTDITEALSAGTWVEVTSYIPSFGAIPQRIEYDFGQFSSDSVQITANNIAWWVANVFDATASQYIEMKLTGSIGISSTAMSSDTFYAFSGMVDKETVEYDELTDSVSFNVFTYDELGNRIRAYKANTQYNITNIAGTATDGIILPRLPGLYLINANVTGYTIREGLHTLRYDGSTGLMYFDNGVGVDPSITDTATSEDGTMKLQIKLDANVLPYGDITDYFVVETYGDTLPKVPWYYKTYKELLTKLFAEIGVTSVTYDTLQLDSEDASNKISYLNGIEYDWTDTRFCDAVVGDGTNLYLCAGGRLLKWTASTQTFEQLETFTSGTTYIKPLKMWYNSRNDEVWIFYLSTAGQCLRVYDVNGDTLSSEYILDAGGAIGIHNISLIDYNYTGSSYKYGVMWGVVGSPGSINFCDNAGTITTELTLTAARDFVANTADFHFFRESTSTWGFKYYDTGITTYLLRAVTIDATGTFIEGLQIATNLEAYSSAIYHEADDKIYYLEHDATPPTNLKSHPRTSSTVTTIATGMVYNGEEAWHYSGTTGKAYLAEKGEQVNEPSQRCNLHVLDDNTDTEIQGINYITLGGLTSIGSVLYFLTSIGELGRYTSTIDMHWDRAYCYAAEENIRTAIGKMCIAYNLVYVIRPNKSAFVYRRANDAGTIQTTGSSITLNETNVTSIQKREKAILKADWVKVTGADGMEVTYDGTMFGAILFADAKLVDVNSDIIPAALIRDVAQIFFTFYNTDHDIYVLEVNMPAMEYEVMDGAAVTLTTTRITKTGTGLIAAQTINENGSMSLEVLF